MRRVTVCIPAYRAGAFIGETLHSVQAQSHPDLRIEIAIDPPEADRPEATREAIDPFLSDDRVHVRENAARLGWDGNIRAMLERIDTPFYVILPHDDLLDPSYIATLLSALDLRPDASVAYGDMTFVGDTNWTLKFVDLPAHGTRRDQLLAFFLAGAEAVPWRGVTRTGALLGTGGFPTDGYQGFAVECEYALSLLLQGPAVRVPRPLYIKRIHAPGVPTASRLRLTESSHETLTLAWQRHRSRMIGLLDEARLDVDGEIVKLAAHAAMLSRYCHMVSKALPPVELSRTHRLLDQAVALSTSSSEARDVAARLRGVLSMHAVGSG